MRRLADLLARLAYALRHICWAHWCARHRLSYVSDLCPECAGERLVRMEVCDRRALAHIEWTGGDQMATELAGFDVSVVWRHVRGGRRNDRERALRHQV